MRKCHSLTCLNSSMFASHGCTGHGTLSDQPPISAICSTSLHKIVTWTAESIIQQTYLIVLIAETCDLQGAVRLSAVG